jgi:hypothetical protein
MSREDAYSTDIGTKVIEHPRRLLNPTSGEYRDVTNLSEDGYLRRFLAMHYAATRVGTINVDDSPVLAFDTDRWAVDEREGTVWVRKRDAETPLGELLLAGADNEGERR